MKYFDISDFDSPDEIGSGSKMSEVLLRILSLVREKYGKPIYINSGYRTISHNENVGGKSNSSHLTGLAIDITDNNKRQKMCSSNRFKLIELFMDYGVNRIGVSDMFIHFDIDDMKSPNVMWIY